MEQVLKLAYLIINGDIVEEVKIQTNKGAIISGIIRDVAWKKKDLSIEAKAGIYEARVMPIMVYGIKAHADHRETK